MDEFESTIAGKPPMSRQSVVYDPRDGRIVYTHEVIGGARDTAAAKAEREKAALASAARHRPDVAGVRVLHLADGFQKDPRKSYRVDPKVGKLVAQATPVGWDRGGFASSPAGAAAPSRPTPGQQRAKPRSRR
jgi:hypothetical protein